MALLTSCDVVIDGPFKMELSDRMLKWCGSANQRVIDVQKTLRQKKIVLYEGEHYEWKDRISLSQMREAPGQYYTGLSVKVAM